MSDRIAKTRDRTVYPDSPIPAVAVVVKRDDEFLMIKRGKEPRKGTWTVPGGSIELGETLNEAAEREVCPAEIDEEVAVRARNIGIMAHRALSLRGYSRTDMILAQDGTIKVLETNTIPGMTPTSLFPQAAAAAGMEFSSLLDRLIELALETGKVDA